MTSRRSHRWARGGRGVVAALMALALTSAACASNGDDRAASGDTGDGQDNSEQEPEDDFPSQPIEIIVGYAAGGGNDLLLRSLAPRLSEELGVDVIVSNHPGSSGAIALTQAYQQGADGYTLLSYSPPGEYLSELDGALGERKDSEWVMLGAINRDPGAFAVRDDSPFQSLEEINEAAQERDLSVAVSGLQSGDGVGLMFYNRQTGVRFDLVPFDSGSNATAACLGGQTDLCERPGGYYDLHGNGLRVLAFAADERLEEFPDIPTVGEVVGKDIVWSATRGLAVRADIPENRLEILTDAFDKAANDPEYIASLLDSTAFRGEYIAAEDMAGLREQMRADVDEVYVELTER